METSTAKNRRDMASSLIATPRKEIGTTSTEENIEITKGNMDAMAANSSRTIARTAKTISPATNPDQSLPHSINPVLKEDSFDLMTDDIYNPPIKPIQPITNLPTIRHNLNI
jgi:hypothetical protein